MAYESEAEITDLERTVRRICEKHVGWLDVSMRHAGLMDYGQSVAQLPYQPGGLGLDQTPEAKEQPVGATRAVEQGGGRRSVQLGELTPAMAFCLQVLQ